MEVSNFVCQSEEIINKQIALNCCNYNFTYDKCDDLIDLQKLIPGIIDTSQSPDSSDSSHTSDSTNENSISYSSYGSTSKKNLQVYLKELL